MSHKRKPSVLLALVSGDISGGGGTERQFADFFEEYHKSFERKFELLLFSNETSLRNLQNVGKLLNTTLVKKNCIIIKSSNNRWIRMIWLSIMLIWTVIHKRIDLIHIIFPTVLVLPGVTLLSFFPRILRPKISLNQVDCSISYTWGTPEESQNRSSINVHRYYFFFLRLDGVFTWYESFKKCFSSKPFMKNTKIASAKYCFVIPKAQCILERKEKILVWAGRLDQQKHPLFFLEGARLALEKNKALFSDWQFVMYGKGPLEPQIKGYLEKHNLCTKILLDSQPDMSTIFRRSRVFVSTQEYENFTSLSMLEAMVYGNAVISRNVGQTHCFVKNNINGLLLDHDSPDGLAEKIIQFVCHPEHHKAYQQASIEIAKNEHNVKNFMADIEQYWESLL
jgi:glycosyltransferase involved in cell wall biosynthesis